MKSFNNYYIFCKNKLLEICAILVFDEDINKVVKWLLKIISVLNFLVTFTICIEMNLKVIELKTTYIIYFDKKKEYKWFFLPLKALGFFYNFFF